MSWQWDMMKKVEDKYEEKIKIMLDCLIRCYIDMDNVDRVTELARVHPFTLMRKDLKDTIETVSGMSVEEVCKIFPIDEYKWKEIK
jgi:hypothetical protein